jgi:hypothetical protein
LRRGLSGGTWGLFFHDTYVQASIAGVFGTGWAFVLLFEGFFLACPLIYIGNMYITVSSV